MNPISAERILLTHPTGRDDSALVVPLEQAGLSYLHYPLITTVKVPYRLPENLDFDWLFMTSVNAVSSFFEQAIPDLAQASFQGAAVGPATAQALSHYASVSFVSPVFDGVSAVQVLHQEYGLTGQKILWPGAKQVNPKTMQAFESVGASVTPLIVYETLPVPNLDAFSNDFIQSFRMLVFTSPSAVDVFYEHLLDKTFRLPLIICQGPTTAKRAEERLGRVDGIANPHTYSGLAQVILQSLSRSLE